MSDEMWVAVTASAQRLNVEAAALMAVVEVESAGKYFAVVGEKDEPLIRFEGHYFDRRLTGSTQARARLRGMSSPLVGKVKNSSNQKDRWPLLDKAIVFNRPAALESTAWGVGQVMGAHWKWLGYKTVEELVKTARSGLEGQVDLMAKYIEKAGLASALRARDWAAFARGYNGPAYAKFGYHIKLEQAYAKANQGEKPSHTVSVCLAKVDRPRRGDRGENVEDLQRQLTSLGYVVAADGIFEGETLVALKKFQTANSIAVDGIIGAQTVSAMEKELPAGNAWGWLIHSIKATIRRAF